jgi:hypothetical protein
MTTAQHERDARAYILVIIDRIYIIDQEVWRPLDRPLKLRSRDNTNHLC